MDKKTSSIVGIAGLVVLIVLAGFVYNSLKNRSPLSRAVVKVQPVQFVDVPLTAADGSAKKLSDYIGNGKPTVINFWASWCSPCKSEMPEFEKLSGELGGSVNFLMINATDGTRETMKTGQDYIAGEGYKNFTVLYDVGEDSAVGTAQVTYGISALPTTFYVDAKGVISAVSQGAITGEDLRSGLSLVS